MGLTFGRLWSRVFGKIEQRILMVGLDAAEKTIILYKLKLGEVVTTVPTIGFNVETVKNKNISFTVWDANKQQIKVLWRHYYNDVNGLIFVVDSNDRERLEYAKYELFGILQTAELKNICILVFANKQDLPNAMNAAELTDKLQLHRLKGRSWYIQETCATNGYGLQKRIGLAEKRNIRKEEMNNPRLLTLKKKNVNNQNNLNKFKKLNKIYQQKYIFYHNKYSTEIYTNFQRFFIFGQNKY